MWEKELQGPRRWWGALKKEWPVVILTFGIAAIGLFWDIRETVSWVDEHFHAILKGPSDPLWRWVILFIALLLILFHIARAEKIAARERRIRDQQNAEQMHLPTLLLRYYVAHRELVRFQEVLRTIEARFDSMKAGFVRYTQPEPIECRPDVPNNFQVVDPTLFMPINQGRFDAFRIPQPTLTVRLPRPELTRGEGFADPAMGIVYQHYLAEHNEHFIERAGAQISEYEAYIATLQAYAAKVEEQLEQWDNEISDVATRTQTGHPLTPSFHNILVD